MSSPEPALHVYADRSPDPDRRDEVDALLDDAQEADGFSGLSDQARLALAPAADTGTPVGPGPGPTTLVLLARTTTTNASATTTTTPTTTALAGLASLSERDGTFTVEVVVRPERRDGPEDVLGALVDAALGEIAARGGGSVGAWLRAPGERDVQALVSRGLEPGRELLQLRAALPPEAVHDASSPPVPVRPFRPGRDEQPWLEVNARAFAGHPDQGSWTLDDLERREHEPWFDPHGFLLHEVDGRLAAFCWTKVHRSPVLGEIYVIGVDPDFQGRGLGRSLTRAGLGHLATRSVPDAMLYVESTNTPALVLYRSLGFTEHHRELQFGATVPPSRQADAPTTRPMP